MSFWRASRYRRVIVSTGAALLMFAGVVFAEFYLSLVDELASWLHPVPEPSFALDLGAASLIVNLIIVGMFIGHLALFGLAGISRVPETGKGRHGAWLARLSALGVLCLGLIATALVMDGGMLLATPDAWSHISAAAAYLLSGVALIGLHLVDGRRGGK